MFRTIALVVSCTIFCMFTAFGQKPANKYDRYWKKVDSLINKKGLTQTASTEVNKIYALAKKEKNDAQLIKALVYKMSLSNQREEDALKKNIAQLEKERSVSQEPSRSVISSILADSYWNYFQQNRWKLYDRTTTANFKKDDTDTWSVDDLHKKISELYLASVSNEKLLQQTRLAGFDPIILKGNVRHLRPTLFDLLAHRALEYFKNDERNVTKPAYAFEINENAAFDPAADFIRHRFKTEDSASLHFQALLIYQRLIAFHIADAKPDALIDVDLDRLQFVRTYARVENKDDLYRLAIQHIASRYEQVPAASQAWFMLARWHADRAQQYDPLRGDSNRYEYVKAKEICEKVVAAKDSSEGKMNCLNLLREIGQKQMHLKVEKVNLPGLPFRMLVSYRNFTQLHYRIIKINKKTRNELGRDQWDDEYWKKIVALPVLKTFTQTLPDTRDYQQHKVEIKVDSLSTGEYALLASTTSEFTLKDNVMGLHYFYVSNIAYINRANDYFVLHRETGIPMGRTNVQVWYKYYDQRAGTYKERKGENIYTDKNGHFTIPVSKTQQNNTYSIELSNGSDYLFMDYKNDYYYYPEPRPEETTTTTFVFTDRAIYRPGQTVYFKGIMTKGKARDHAIVPNQKATVYLLNANAERVDSITLTTNEFGSYSGKFTLPEGLLNGVFQLEDNIAHTGATFSVEEYKRPKFSVTIEKPAGTYKLNDSIKVTGIAKSYAGNNIDGAEVTFRVVRKTRWIIYDYGFSPRIWPPHRRDEMEIANGKAKTDGDGKFTISFKAIPDNSISKTDQPLFYYEVSADVTDINGETRSGNTSVIVAHQALQLQIDLPEKISPDTLKDLRIGSTNLNDLFEKTSVTVSMYKLKVPQRIFRQRYWDQPDQFVLTEEEYHKLFPYDIYRDEDQVSKWLRDAKVLEVTDTTREDKKFGIGNRKLEGGWYVIEAVTKDKYGEEVKALKYIQLTGPGSNNPIAYGDITVDKPVSEAGDRTNYRLSTNLDSIWAIHNITRTENRPRQQFVSILNGQRDSALSITEEDRGGITLDMSFVKHNRFYSAYTAVQVPFSNKQLSVTYATYRDKTLPGTEEKWKVKISGYKTDKIAAELLTAMYDASLDQFMLQQWNIPPLWMKSNSPVIYSSTDCFGMNESIEKYNPVADPSFVEKQYDQLIAGQPGMDLSGSIPPGSVRRMTIPSKLADGLYANGKVRAEAAAQTKIIFDEAASNRPQESRTDTIITPKMPATVQVRKNLNETAFFFPDLKTDSSGSVEFSFTMPEALTQWKWMSLAHTKDLAFGYAEKNIITQKQLMVQPNPPRFMREGDRMDFSTKIVNMTATELTGQVALQLIDPTTNQPVDGWFRNVFPNQYFTVGAGQSAPAQFSIEVPFQYNRPVTYRVIATTQSDSSKRETFSDGEESTLAVVSNRMLVTESLPINIRSTTSKQFTFGKLVESGNSQTLNHHALTVEFTSNPAWYAVQALPYLMEYPYECSEQVFNRYYANALASLIANSSPRIKQVFEKWKTADTAALLSNLQKNPELKSVLLEETPWVLEAKNEQQQKKNIALLFDMIRMSRELESSLNKLTAMQTEKGGFVWFKGGTDDRYITQYILSGIGRLKKLNALPKDQTRLNTLIKSAILYADRSLKEDYDYLVKRKANLKENHLGSLQVQYLYMRSLFAEYAVPGEIVNAYNYYRKQSQQFWLQQSRYMQGMIALSLYRTGDIQNAKNIVESLKQNSIISEEMGMYWKEFNSGGYYWYQSPIEAHSLLIEVFSEILKDNKITDDLKTWLLKQKQTTNWRTTKATADACYALLLQGTKWIDAEPNATIRIGNITISSDGAEAGTGYIKKVFDGKQVKPEMGNISVNITGQPQTSWGAVYWQYFENLENITPARTPLQLTKKLFVESNTDRGPVITPLNDGASLKVGDKLKVRIELKSDRNLEYVHMKDMRAACMEPINVISAYKWQGGLGYYESTKDASTNFFFSYLPRGTWVFEYTLFVTHTGSFSNGVTTIQSMYAPEFSSHSEGIRVNVE